MSTQYKNSGIISRNARQRAGQRDPDIAGDINNLICPHCNKSSTWFINGWKKEGTRGIFYSLSMVLKRGPQTQQSAQRQPGQEG